MTAPCRRMPARGEAPARDAPDWVETGERAEPRRPLRARAQRACARLVTTVKNGVIAEARASRPARAAPSP